ncbi:conserved hypothetical protein [Candidatus Brocadia pituitae]|nr:conserved hypothetical protein [Candidatus Brocadia pituitae]
MKITNTELAQLVERCFDLSMDARLNINERKDFLAIGKRLRGSLLNLLSAQFKDNTQAVIDANNQLKVLNAKLQDTISVLQNIAQVITQLGSLVKILDDLLKTASSFV